MIIFRIKPEQDQALLANLLARARAHYKPLEAHYQLAPLEELVVLHTYVLNELKRRGVLEVVVDEEPEKHAM